jgi:outer membrane receptor for ferrienterochelin and colicins
MPRIRVLVTAVWFVLLLPVLPWWPTVAAQVPEGTVVVQVRGDHGPLPGSEVRSGTVQAFTDDEGRARLTVAAGLVRIDVSHLGYGPASVRAEVRAGEETRIGVRLHPEALALEGLTVSSTRTGRRVQDEPLRVEILDREEIEEKMLMTPGNIVMLLNETGGLRVQVTSPALGAANIRIQGMPGRYTQLLADGLPLYGGQAGAIGLMQVPPVDLGQVEVIKGVASALYGGAALGGVVNLISLRPDEESSGELLLNATTHNGQDATIHLSGPLAQGWGYSLLGGTHRQTRQDLDGTGWADVPAHRRMILRPRLFWDDGGGGTALVTVGGMTERREGGTLPGRNLPDGTSFPETLETDRVDLGFTVQRPLQGPVNLQLRGSAMAQDHRHVFGGLTEEDSHGTAFAEVALTGTVGPHAWVVGGALQQDRYRSETFPAFDYTFTVPAVFAQGEVRASGDLIASASARWDEHNVYGSQFSPRVSVLYRPGPWILRTSIGGGFFAPTPFTEETEAAGLSRLAPVTGLRAERARTLSLDAGRTVGAVELNGTVFAARVTDAVRLVPMGGEQTGGAAQVRLRNVAGATRTHGAEVLLRYRWDDVSMTGSYMFVEATEPEEASSLRRAIPLTPRHTAGVVAMWEDHDRGLLGVEAYYTGRQELDGNPYRTRGRPHVHVGILGELRWGAVSVFLNAENLLDVRQTRHDPLIRERRAPDGRWTVDAWGPIEGFVLNGGVRIRFGGRNHAH